MCKYRAAKLIVSNEESYYESLKIFPPYQMQIDLRNILQSLTTSSKWSVSYVEMRHSRLYLSENVKLT